MIRDTPCPSGHPSRYCDGYYSGETEVRNLNKSLNNIHQQIPNTQTPNFPSSDTGSTTESRESIITKVCNALDMKNTVLLSKLLPLLHVSAGGTTALMLGTAKAIRILSQDNR